MTDKKFTVLVVDDDEDLRDSVALLFESEGHNVLTATNGEEAIEIVKSKKIHVVVSDIRMPKTDGVELLKKIKVYNASVPVVFLITGFADISEKELLCLGACGLISKPFNGNQLIDIVTKACSSLPV